MFWSTDCARLFPSLQTAARGSPAREHDGKSQHPLHVSSRIEHYRISKTVATRLTVETSLIALLRLRVREPVQTHPRESVFWPGWATSEVEQESKQDRIGFALPGQPTTIGWRGMT
jgi:hypothetical protein